jgi:hypothetical protein
MKARCSSVSRDSTVSIATGYRLEGQVQMFLFIASFRPVLGPNEPPIQEVLEHLFPRLKRLGCEADQAAPTSAEVNNIWIHTSTPPYVFIALVLN